MTTTTSPVATLSASAPRSSADPIAGEAGDATSGVEAGEAVEPSAEGSNFVSRREELGRPRSIVPEGEPILERPEPRSDSRTGSWYKLGAGLLFLISLGYIGYRQKRTRRTETSDWSDLERPLSRWLPPEEAMDTRSFSTSPLPTGSVASREDSDLLVKDLRSSSRGRGASLRSFDAYDEPPPAGDAGFHPEIEKRVRRLRVDQPASPRTAKGASYAAIGELHARGYEPEDIARHLGLGLAEVRTYLQIERSPMLD